MSKNKNGNKILKYNETQMLEAIQAVKNGMAVIEASRTFQVPKTTLTYKLSGKYPVERKMGPASYISKPHEDILVNWIVESQKRGFAISRYQLVESVKKLVIDLNLKTPFKDNKPGKKWVELFLHRHPEITKRIPQTLTVPRAAVTQDILFSWFDEIENYIEENNLSEVIADPSRVFNADESAFFLNPNGGKVLAEKGNRNVYQLGNDEKECLTVLFTANAAGMIPPPMMIFKYERVPSYIVSSIPKGWGIGRSESGWMCGPTFYEYMANIFKPWLDENNIARPVIFFIDGHVSHLTLHVSQYCSANGIILICLVANATHIMQPMDVSVFRPLKAAWKQSIECFKNETKLVTLKKEHAGIILKKALDNLDLQGTITNGFRACGLFPLTRNGIDLRVLHPSKKNEETEGFPEDTPPTDIGTHLVFIESLLGAEKVTNFKKCIEETVEWVGSPNDLSLYDFYKKVYLMSKSGSTEAAEDNANRSDAVNLSDPQHSTPHNSPVKDYQEAATKSFEGTLPSPFKRSFCWPEVGVKKNKRRKEHIPFVVSSTAYQQYYAKKLAKKKEDEEAKQKRKEQREQKKSIKEKDKNKNKKPKSTSSESELSESHKSLYSDTESEDFDSHVSEEEELKEQSNQTGECSKNKEKQNKTEGKLLRKKQKKEIKLSSFVAVIYEGEFFPGQVLKLKNRQYFVKAMAMSGYNWKWPATEDTCWYDECDVLQALSVPQKINERGTFRVPEIDELRNMSLK